jgi:hypothetical protein
MTRKKHTRTRPETPAEWAERTRREQGLPAMITDPLGSAVAVVLLAAIVYYAWTWPKEAQPTSMT